MLNVKPLRVLLYTNGIDILVLLLCIPNKVQAQSCAAAGGQYYNTNTSQCVNCIGNTYCLPNQLCTNACIECPPQTVARSDKTNCDSGTCTVCPVGSYCSGGSSIAGCPTGQYNSITGISSSGQCQSCSAGKFSSVINSSSCTNCSAGMYNAADSSTGCTNCENGKYQPSQGQVYCIFCPAGRYGTGTGFTTMETNCTKCVEGTFSNTLGASSNTNCQNCAAGKYGLSAGASLESQCTACSAGTYSFTSGASKASVCLDCPVGTYQALSGQMYCTNCSAGTYSSATKSTLNTTCALCPSYTQTLDAKSSSINDCRCSPGYNATTGGPYCSACPRGTYTSSIGTLLCISCPSGKYDPNDVGLTRNLESTTCEYVPTNAYSWVGAIDFSCNAGYSKEFDGSTGSSVCTICSAGTYAYKGDNTCANCTNGNTRALSGTTKKDDCVCNAGYYKPTNTSDCVICPKNSYCPGGFNSLVSGQHQQPIQCLPGTYTEFEGSTSFTNCWCLAGYYGVNTVQQACTICPPNSYCPGLLPNSTLNTCPINTFSAQGSNLLTNCSCLAGYEAPSAAKGVACTLCPINQYCYSGARSSCRQNANTTGLGAFGESNCSCVPGYYSVNDTSTCIQCPKDTYCMGGKHMQQCGQNFTTFDAVQQTQPTACSCKTMYYYKSNDSTCNACPADAWCVGGNVTFNPCRQNASAPTMSFLSEHCTCNDGYQGSQNGGCISCGAGTYTLTRNTTGGCTSCVAGMYSTGTAMTSAAACTYCVAGTYSGTVGAMSSLSCQNCGIGKYSDTVGATGSNTCLNCAVGTVNVNQGSNSIAACEKCSAGKYSSALNGAGYAADCVNCGAGKFSSMLGAISSLNCSNCFAGSWSSNAVATSNTTCTYCLPGTISNVLGASSSATCSSCAAGTYSTGSAASVPCTICGMGTYNPSTGASSATNCLACVPGKYNPSNGSSSETACTFCVSGTYNMYTGQDSESDCLACGQGKYSTGSGMVFESNCTLCTSGTYNVNTGSNSAAACIACGMGSYSGIVGATVSSTCIKCLPGKYNANTGSNSAAACIACGTGSYSWIGAQSCYTCLAGSVLQNYS